MKIQKSKDHQMRNSEHVQFHTEVKDIIEGIGVNTLKIEEHFNHYLSCYIAEDEAYKKIVKSSITEDMETADQMRDMTFSGLAQTNHAALNHYEPEVVFSARRLEVVFDTYGNLAKKPLNEETAAINNLLQDLMGNYAQDVQKVGLEGWVQKLRSDNNAFDMLVKERKNENVEKTQLKMKETRTETFKAYCQIVERINALIVVEGEGNYARFVNEVNYFVDKYNNAIAQHTGRKH